MKKLAAPLSEEQITIRDFLTHRAGITSNGLGLRTSYTGQYDLNIALNMLSNFSSPRSPAYQYTNLGYVMTGFAMENATGVSWKKLEREKIFDPIGMQNTTSYASKAIASGNYAVPYRSNNGKFIKLPYKNDKTMHAAGGTVSSAEDLAKWLRVMMNDGMYGEKRIISSRSMREILGPQINQDRNFYKYHRYSYGLGWNIATYKNEEFIHCFGTYAGFRPHVSFMPKHDIGVVVLVNESSESILLPDLIANEIYDYMLGKRELIITSNTDIESYLKNIKRRRTRISAREIKAKAEKPSGKARSFPLNKYVGKYTSDEFGEIEIRVRGNKLFAKMGNLTGYLTHENEDSFEIDVLVLRPMKLIFNSGKNKVIETLALGGNLYIKN